MPANTKENQKQSNISLLDLGIKYGTRKVLHGYLPVYEKYLKKIRMKVKNVLELGIKDGDSLKMWRDYFPNAIIYGIDLEDYDLKDKRIKTYNYDAGDRNELSKFIDDTNVEFDIIVDDCGHWNYQQQVSLGFLFKYLKSGGWYVIEDLTSHLYRPYYPIILSPINSNNVDISNSIKPIQFRIMLGKYGVMPNQNNTTLTMIKRYIDERKIISYYLLKPEIDYLESYLNTCYLHEECLDNPEDTGQDRQSGIICFFKKKS